VATAETLQTAASRAAEKLKLLSFRGTLRAEESLLLLPLEQREIPHFVRNDKTAYFSSTSLVVGLFEFVLPLGLSSLWCLYWQEPKPTV
jgi:hypothetical protein